MAQAEQALASARGSVLRLHCRLRWRARLGGASAADAVQPERLGGLGLKSDAHSRLSLGSCLRG
jgi:hypothetical protein